jgi:hypothetical protein
VLGEARAEGEEGVSRCKVRAEVFGVKFEGLGEGDFCGRVDDALSKAWPSFTTFCHDPRYSTDDTSAVTAEGEGDVDIDYDADGCPDTAMHKSFIDCLCREVWQAHGSYVEVRVAIACVDDLKFPWISRESDYEKMLKERG